MAPALKAAPEAEMWSYWDQHGSQVGIDHADWQVLLDRFVLTHADGINRVAYDELRQEAKKDLRAYIDRLAALDPRNYTLPEQKAYWINLYNAATVEVVLQYPQKKSIRRMGKKFFAIGPWDDTVRHIAGEAVSLNDMEHRILRPIWQDHRIHYAVNCASLGCPNLARDAYTAEAMEQQLQAAEEQYLAHPRAVSVEQDRVILSKIYDWYGVDFGADENAVLSYIAGFHKGLRKRLQEENELTVDYEYSWELNSVTPR